MAKTKVRIVFLFNCLADHIFKVQRLSINITKYPSVRETLALCVVLYYIVKWKVDQIFSVQRVMSSKGYGSKVLKIRK